MTSPLNKPGAGAKAAAQPPARRLAVLGGLLVAVAGAGAYLTWGAEPVDAAPAPAPVPAPVSAPAPAPRRPAGVPAVPAAPTAPNSAAARADSATTPPAPEAGVPDTVVIEREVFGYAGGGRRDPFRPLIVTTVLRPFASELKLVAVAYDPSGAHSVAILRDQTTKAQHRVRPGQLVGRMRVVRIQPKAVVFAVEELGFSRRETLTLHDSLGTSPSRQP